jgi:hypothetical protein
MSVTETRKVLYLPSTPLNLLVSVAHAVHFATQQRARLVLIDQKQTANNPYLQALQSWTDAPFETVTIGPGQAKGWRKLVERKQHFKKLKAVWQAFPADSIAVGSDRRVEFQYLMQLGRQTNAQLEGWYLDDGLYSYAGRPYQRWKDGVNAGLKKLAYGLWWREPSTVGASSWIDQAWLFRPEHAVAALQNKSMRTIEIGWFAAPGVQRFSEQVCAVYGLAGESLERLQQVESLLLIPHPNNIEKMPGYVARIEAFLKTLQAHGQRVAVKYHPRTEQRDPLELEARFGALLVPAGLAFEFVLPFLPARAWVIGDVGTALLTAKWLRPELHSVAVLNENSAFEDAFRPVLQNLGVRVVKDYAAAWEARA